MPRDDDDDPRWTNARDDGNEDYDPPRRDEPRDEGRAGRAEPTDIKARPMPLQLIGAIIASIFWGGLLLHGSCVGFAHSTMAVISFHNANAFGFRGAGVGGEGFWGTMAAAQFFVFLLAATLLVGGVLLLMRKGFAKFIVMGVPAAIVLVELATAVVCLIITSGLFLAEHNFDFLIIIVFSLVVGGLNAYFLLNKDASKALN